LDDYQTIGLFLQNKLKGMLCKLDSTEFHICSNQTQPCSRKGFDSDHPHEQDSTVITPVRQKQRNKGLSMRKLISLSPTCSLRLQRQARAMLEAKQPGQYWKQSGQSHSINPAQAMHLSEILWVVDIQEKRKAGPISNDFCGQTSFVI